jgi:hypothetical protein
MPEDGEPLLSMARYMPGSLLKDSDQYPGEAALVGLVRSGLLKRFESSVCAFAKTLERLVATHDAFLEGLDRGKVFTADEIDEWRQTDSDEAIEDLLESSRAESTANYRIEELREYVANDRSLLDKLRARATKVQRKDDPKLKALVDSALKPILKQAKREAADEADFRRKRKVIIFSYFSDTVDWIFEYLKERFDSDLTLRTYRGRLVALRGDTATSDDIATGSVSREEAVFRFAPESSEAPEGYTDDFDVLVTTDVLAEGMNLQDCRNVINYDLPWNPMRLVQRHGRVDRLGSRHLDVYIGCFFPDARLEALLELETRIRRKVAKAAATVGIEHEVIPGAATSERVFTETREEIEKLRRENTDLFEKSGEPAGAQSGEAYRQELRKGLEQFGDAIRELPGGAGSGMRGPRAGHFFCARVGERVYMRFVPAGLVDSNDPLIERDSLNCLRAIACTEKSERLMSAAIRASAYGAWQLARRDIYEKWMVYTDPVNLQPKVKASMKRAAAAVRKYPPAGATQEVVDKLANTLEAPWGVRIEAQIRGAMGDTVNAAAAVRIAETVRRLKLQPFEVPEPLPVIGLEEVGLVCWMGVEGERPASC